MKRIILAVFFLSCITSFTAIAQRPVVGCIDKNIRLQADEIKQHYTSQGFVVYRDAMINMESQVPSPVILELQKGEMYQIIYVGTPEVYRMNLDMYDEGENKLLERFVFKNRQQPNYILVNYIPERTGSYLFTLQQKLKSRTMCGSFCILKMGPDKRKAVITPYQ